MNMNSSLPSLAIANAKPPSQVELCQKKWEMAQLMNPAIQSEKYPISAIEKVRIRATVLEYHLFLQEHPLTKRELEILRLIVEGNSNSEIGQTLHLTIGTVKTHLRNIFYKLNVNDRTQAAVIALRAGLVD
jgi:DNA-binding NarL/FixJ family response regulator